MCSVAVKKLHRNFVVIRVASHFSHLLSSSEPQPLDFDVERIAQVHHQITIHLHEWSSHFVRIAALTFSTAHKRCQFNFFTLKFKIFESFNLKFNFPWGGGGEGMRDINVMIAFI